MIKYVSYLCTTIIIVTVLNLCSTRNTVIIDFIIAITISIITNYNVIDLHKNTT